MKCRFCATQFSGEGACPACGRVDERLGSAEGSFLVKLGLALLLAAALLVAVLSPY